MPFFTFTEEILNGKLHFLCSESYSDEFFKIQRKTPVMMLFLLTLYLELENLYHCAKTLQFNLFQLKASKQ